MAADGFRRAWQAASVPTHLRESRWFLHGDDAMIQCAGFRCGLLAGGLEPDDQLCGNPALVLDLDAPGSWPLARGAGVGRTGSAGAGRSLAGTGGRRSAAAASLARPGAATWPRNN